MPTYKILYNNLKNRLYNIKMEFTFGIITAGDNDHYIQTIIDSIRENHIPIYEIIIVGNTKIQQDGIIRVFEFDETIRAGWITKKKKYDCITC